MAAKSKETEVEKVTTGRKCNIGTELVNKEKDVSEQVSKVSFEKSDCEEEVDSTILVRERARGSKLESAFQKKRGRILDETDHTLTFLPERKKKPTKWSERDMAKSYSPPLE